MVPARNPVPPNAAADNRGGASAAYNRHAQPHVPCAPRHAPRAAPTPWLCGVCNRLACAPWGDVASGCLPGAKSDAGCRWPCRRRAARSIPSASRLRGGNVACGPCAAPLCDTQTPARRSCSQRNMLVPRTVSLSAPAGMSAPRVVQDRRVRLPRHLAPGTFETAWVACRVFASALAPQVPVAPWHH